MAARQATTTPGKAPPLGRSLHALWASPRPEGGPPGSSGPTCPPGSPHAATHGPSADDPWDLIVVGTGYGGSMAAATLAACTVEDAQGRQRPARVCILERGQEWRPGQFPSRLAELPGHLRIGQQATGQAGGQAEGLFDVRLGEDVVALVANGVGGGSLINAGVMLEPQPQDLRRPDFQAEVRALQQEGWYRRARVALGAERPGPAGPRLNTIALHPAHAAQPLPKAQAMNVLAGRHASAQPLPITVALQPGPNAAGVELPACTLCGDCMTGCNVGAKDSLDANLLRQAVQAGAQLFTGASVSRVRPFKPTGADAGGQPTPTGQAAQPDARWVVEVEHTRADLQAREAGPLQLHARRVILAAGTFGSTEILLRSRSAELGFSQRLGERFSCNGDNIGAVHRLRDVTQGCADETTALDARGVGPTITTGIAFEAQAQQGSRPFWLQEFSVPGALRRLFEEIVTTGHAMHQLPEADVSRHGGAADPAIDPAAVDPEAMVRTLLVGLIGHDDANGVLALPGAGTSALGTLRIHWPQARDSRTLDTASAAVQRRVEHLHSLQAEAAEAEGAPPPDGPHWVPNPMWRLLPDALSSLADQPRGPVLTVHPLGGCPLGEDAQSGVVDRLGRVFDGQAASAQAVHDGLVVLDGSIVPESLGANPSLTIAALALRASEALAPAWGWQRPAPETPPPATQPRPVGMPRTPLPGASPTVPTRVAVIERLTGPVGLDLEDRPGGARPWMVEWTLAYQPERLDQLSAPLNRCLTVDAASPHSRLRLYDAATWEARGLAGQTDEWRHRHAVFEARLSGTLRFLHREDSFALQRMVRGLGAWVRHRAGRDLYQSLAEAQFGVRQLRRLLGLEAPPAKPGPGLWALGAGALRSASRAGEVRRFDYRLEVGEVLGCSLRDTNGRLISPLQAGDVLQGHKRLTYAAPGNPWRQLTELQVTRMPGMVSTGAKAGGTLVLDPRFLAQRQTPLLRIVDQQDQVQALADLAGFALTMLRLMASIHLWTFRKPDTPADPLKREPMRLPQPIRGLPAPQVIEWAVAPARDGRPEARVRLTRYPVRAPGPAPHSGDQGARRPALVMIHGYSVSGNTFTHESLQPSAAEWFHHQGRDVWVVDLRTSSGLPTATVPWTMEEVALVDLPAVLLHVRQVTGGPVDVLAHCVGCVMLSMALLSRPQELRARARQLDRPPGLNRAQQAVLAAFNGAGQGREHPTVRKVVLSQKGPVLRYTDDNVLRGWFMQYARRWLLRDGYQFRPSAQPGAGEQLLDRLLASLPYPDADWRVENPRRPWKRTPWTATRHRMDVLYGRDFEATGLRPATLEAIDDLFGPIDLDTVSQTIHFTQSDQATDHTGAGDYVTPGRLRERWAGVETLALHGRDNGLADVFTQRLLGLHLAHAGVPVVARTYDGMGHQDLLIGRRSPEVFQDVERFLRDGVAAFGGSTAMYASKPAGPLAQPPARPADLVVRAPWLGPRLDVLATPKMDQHADQSADQSADPGVEQNAGQNTDRTAEQKADARPSLLRVAAMPPLDAGVARLVLVPMRRAAQGWRLTAGRWGLSRAAGRSRQWQFVHAARLVAPFMRCGEAAADPRGPDGWLALMLYGPDEQADLPMDLPWPGLNGAPPLAPAAAPGAPGASGNRISQARKAIRRWMGQAPSEELEACWVPRQALQRLAGHLAHSVVAPGGGLEAAPMTTPAQPPRRVHLAVASCQYPQGPLDGTPAQASLQHMADQADQGRLDLALFLGDQIYADATAGLVDPTRRDERYETPHERAQRAPGLRRVLARLPSVMLLDDHELVDNWEPRPAGASPALPLWRSRVDALRDGRWGYWKYQRMRPQQRVDPARDLADKAFVFAGLPLYLADTRTGR